MDILIFNISKAHGTAFMQPELISSKFIPARKWKIINPPIGILP